MIEKSKKDGDKKKIVLSDVKKGVYPSYPVSVWNTTVRNTMEQSYLFLYYFGYVQLWVMMVLIALLNSVGFGSVVGLFIRMQYQGQPLHVSLFQLFQHI